VRDHVLALGWLRDEVVPKEECISGGSPMSVWASYLVGVRVDNKLGRGGAMKVKAKIQWALKIAQDMLQGSHVQLSGIMQVKTDLLNCV
jgi:hypothetical protein